MNFRILNKALHNSSYRYLGEKEGTHIYSKPIGYGVLCAKVRNVDAGMILEILLITRVRDNILKSKEQKNIQPTKGGHKMVTCQNYVSLFYRQITSCPSDGGIS